MQPRMDACSVDDTQEVKALEPQLTACMDSMETRHWYGTIDSSEAQKQGVPPVPGSIQSTALTAVPPVPPR